MKTRRAIAVALMMVATVATWAQEASIDTLMKHIRYLSSSRYAGRMAGTGDYMEAAQYAIDVLGSYGVKPFEENWIQYYYDVECNRVESARLSTYFNANDRRTDYVLGHDFACASMTGRGYADAQVVFCGYGIDNPNFDEYARIDAKGKIVMVLTGVPEYLPKSVSERYVSLRDKARVARAHGALALVAVNLSERCRPGEVQCLMDCGEPPHLATFPILQATRRCGESLLADERITLDSALVYMENNRKPFSFLLDKKFAIDVNATYNPTAKTGNVVGVMEGTDKRLKREYIVIGASLDYVGMQGSTCFFPGADNATGAAVLLEVARMLSETDDFIGRSIVFVLFSGGEHHNVGSDVFVQTFDKLDWVDAFLDVERVGSGDSIAVLGNRRFPIIHGIAVHNDSLHTGYVKHDLRAMPQGNAAAFARIGIPALNFYTTNGHRYDHVPSDIVENIDRRMVSRVATLLYHTVAQLCNGDYQGRSEESRYVKFDPTLDDITPYSTGGSIDAKW